MKINNTIKILGLLFGLYIVLYLSPSFCIGGIRAYYTIGLVLIITSWVVSFKILKYSSSWWRVGGVLLTVIISLTIWVIILNERGIHMICW